MLTQSEAMSRAFLGDKEAMLAIMQKQQEGQWLRLYPNGRKGPFDEGFVTVLYGMTLDKIFLVTGRPTDILVLDKALTTNMLQWSYKILSDFTEGCGGDEELYYARREDLLRGRTKGLVVNCSEGDGTILITISPKGRLWSFSFNDCRQLAWKILDVCEALGWSEDELGVSDIVDELREF
jgi:hypothetical protein